MSTKQRKIADDGWAVWIDGDDKSNVYINDWINPKGTSYVDFSVKIIGAKASKSLNVYVPFSITREEIEDISLKFKDKKTIQAVFSVSCILDFMKNEHTSEVAYNGKDIKDLLEYLFSLESIIKESIEYLETVYDYLLVDKNFIDDDLRQKQKEIKYLMKILKSGDE